jgi:hypothetical protein
LAGRIGTSDALADFSDGEVVVRLIGGGVTDVGGRRIIGSTDDGSVSIFRGDLRSGLVAARRAAALLLFGEISTFMHGTHIAPPELDTPGAGVG